MENIMKRLTRPSKTDVVSFRLPKSFASSSVTKTINDPESKISKNKILFAEIFGEEAPNWWGNFSTTVH